MTTSYGDNLERHRVFADFQYPLSTGAPVPMASIDGLCVGCLGAWPCANCSGGFQGAVPPSGPAPTPCPNRVPALAGC